MALHETAHFDQQLRLPEYLQPVPVTVAEVDQLLPGVLDTFLKADEVERIPLEDGYTLMYEGMTTHCLSYTLDVADYMGEGRAESQGIIFIDQDEQGRFAGYGEADVVFRLEATSSNDGIPFVGYTETDGEHREQGLNKRRLKLMNEVVKNQYGKPLHSDLNGWIEKEAEATWKSLEKDGLVEEAQGRRKHWRFKDDSHA